MINLLRLSLAAALTLTIAACASAPPPPEADYAPPGKRQLDAKTQLESGRRY
jgi:predicted small lipoprotein YifL